VSVTAIDPHAGNDRGPRQIRGEAEEGQADHEAFRKNLDAAGLTERVHHVRRFSHDALDAVPVHLDVLYIDGAHGLRAARDDLVRWGRKVRPGGLMLVHDAYSAVGVTLALLTTTVAGRSFRYLGRDGSLARYRREQLRGVDRFANAGRQLLPLAWFARNLVVKLLLVAHLGQVARLLGHDGETWPF
jgi:Methyltransferase domain